MDVILMEKVENLGDLGDKVSVKAGFARNYLVPRGKAKLATAENLAEFEQRKAELERIAAEILEAAQQRKAQAESVQVLITAKAGAEGKLFGSIGPREIAEAAATAGLEIEKKEIRMPQGPLRSTGVFEVGLHFHTDVDATLGVVVEAED